jgi:hypothetical protein
MCCIVDDGWPGSRLVVVCCRRGRCRWQVATSFVVGWLVAADVWASSMVVVVVDEQSVCLLTMSKSSVGVCGKHQRSIWIPYTFRGFCSGEILSRGIPAFRRNLNSIQNSAGIFLSTWQVPLPKLIPLEFQELSGFWQESVGDSKDLRNAANQKC